MEARLRRVDEELSDVLGAIVRVGDDDQLRDWLFDQLVDLLLEGILAELQMRLANAELSPLQFCAEREALLGQCRSVGLVG